MTIHTIKDAVIMTRNAIMRFIYTQVLKRIYFRIDPEKVHDTMTRVGQILGRTALTRAITRAMFSYENPVLVQTVAGIRFANPIGLAAGFDKDAVLTDIMGSVGFGFEEVGSITGEACAGNPKPRLWRLKRSKGLVVYYGLKNEGCARIARRLTDKRFSIPIGTSVAMTNDETTATRQAGIADYAKAFGAFADIGDYFTVNISCPNTCGGEPFTDPDALDALLGALDAVPTQKPIFLKLAADLPVAQLDAIIAVADNHRVHGFICTNLTKKRGTEHIKDDTVPEYGGISGKPVQDLSDGMIEHVYKKTRGRYVIIGCGGIFSAHDAYRKITLGASLVQMVTGMIFEGPQVVSEINREMVRLLKADGFATITEAVGSKNGAHSTEGAFE